MIAGRARMRALLAGGVIAGLTCPAGGQDLAPVQGVPQAMTAEHVTKVRLYWNYPRGTDARAARQRFEQDLAREVGTRSGHCDCPNLEPFGVVLSAESVGQGDYRDHGHLVSYGMETTLGCACPKVHPSEDPACQQQDYDGFKNALRRLKENCGQGKNAYCAPFDAYLERFRDLCSTRFAGEMGCTSQAEALRGEPRRTGPTLADAPVERRVSFNMPCDRSRLATCAKCVEFQMQLTDFAEDAGRDTCRESGYPTLISYRNVACQETAHGPHPTYQADCGR